jgi:hypothetical protein
MSQQKTEKQLLDVITASAKCELLTVDYREIVPYTSVNGSANPRKYGKVEIHNLAEGIKQSPELFMNRLPILSDRTGKLMSCAGHLRVDAVLYMGVTHAPAVVCSGLTPAQEEQILLLDNPLPGVSGEWDLSALEAGFSDALKALEVDTGALFASLQNSGFGDGFGGDGNDFGGDGGGDNMEQVAKITVSVPMDDLLAFETELDGIILRYPDVQKRKKVVRQSGEE